MSENTENHTVRLLQEMRWRPIAKSWRRKRQEPMPQNGIGTGGRRWPTSCRIVENGGGRGGDEAMSVPRAIKQGDAAVIEIINDHGQWIPAASVKREHGEPDPIWDIKIERALDEVRRK